MLEGPILAKDLAVEYKYLANTSEWFYIARKNAERVIRNMTSLTKGKKFGSTLPKKKKRKRERPFSSIFVFLASLNKVLGAT
jgi:G protein-coupled receptor 158